MTVLEIFLSVQCTDRKFLNFPEISQPILADFLNTDVAKNSAEYY